MNSDDTFSFGHKVDALEASHKPQHHSLRNCAERAMAEYFSYLDGHDCTDLYQMVLQEVEEPLMAAVMKYTRNNQSKASEMLGLNRGTLRKKLKLYDLL